MAARRLLGLDNLTACVGAHFEHDGACVIPLPHPSGASSWLKVPANRERVASAVELIRVELAGL